MRTGEDTEHPAAYLRLSLRRLTTVLDALPHGFVLCDGHGRIRHCTPSVLRLMEEDFAQLEEEITLLCLALPSTQRYTAAAGASGFERHVRTRRGEYVLRAFALRGGRRGEELYLVLLEGFTPEPVSDSVLRQLYRLTWTEIRVARLLAEGLSNTDIASALHISPHTARHHVEHVLHKLGVCSRERARAVLLPQRAPAVTAGAPEPG